MNNKDFDQIDTLAKTKDFSMLTDKERQLILSHFDNEEEYNSYRMFTAFTAESLKQDSAPEVDPGIELRVMEHMRLSGNNRTSIKQQGFFTSILGLFSIHSLGLKTSVAMVAIIGTFFFSVNDQPNGSYYMESGSNLIADTTIEPSQDSSFLHIDSSTVGRSF